MNWLKQNWFKVGVIVLMVVISASYFYWYEWRPNKIVKECNTESIEKTKKASEDQDRVYDFFYKFCLREKGL